MSMLFLGGWAFVDILLDFSNQWYWLVIATLYIITVEETFAHRICAHRMFTVDTSSTTYKILTFLCSVNQSHGPTRYLAIWHPAHHMYSDKGKADNVNFKEFWWGSASTIPVEFLCDFQIPNVDKVVEHGYRTSKEIIDDSWAQFCERYSLTISTVTLVVLFLLSPIILVNVVLLGRFIMMLGMMAAGICHIKGIPLTYRLANTNDDSNNNLIIHYLFLGIFSGLLQNNHHSNPNAVSLGFRWWEIDTSAPISHTLKYVMEKKNA
jgi:fatty-acid desaturase